MGGKGKTEATVCLAASELVTSILKPVSRGHSSISEQGVHLNAEAHAAPFHICVVGRGRACVPPTDGDPWISEV